MYDRVAVNVFFFQCEESAETYSKSLRLSQNKTVTANCSIHEYLEEFMWFIVVGPHSQLEKSSATLIQRPPPHSLQSSWKQQCCKKHSPN